MDVQKYMHVHYYRSIYVYISILASVGALIEPHVYVHNTDVRVCTFTEKHGYMTLPGAYLCLCTVTASRSI